MSPDKITVGEYRMKTLRILREQSKLSQCSVAWSLGISPSAYSYIESGRSSLKFVNAIKLAWVYKCSLDDIAATESFKNVRLDEMGEMKEVES